MNVEQIIDQAYRHYQAGDRGRAQTLCRQILAQIPDCGNASYLLAVIAQDSGQLEESLSLLRSALASSPENPVFCNALGELLFLRGAADEAMSLFQRSVAARPTYERAHNNLGRVFHASGKYDVAVTHFNEAIRLNPQYATAHNNLGATLLVRGDLDGAIRHCREALQSNPQYPEALFNLGSALHARGDSLTAVTHLQSAVRLRPSYARAHAMLAQTLINLGQVASSLEPLQAVVNLEPSSSEAHCRLANVLVLLGRTEAATSEFDAALQLDPDNAECFAQRFHLKEQLCDWSGRPEALQRLWQNVQDAGKRGQTSPVVPLHAASLPWTVAQLCEVARSHARGFQRFASNRDNASFSSHARETGRLKIGYLSRDLYDHPVGHQIAGLFALHDRNKFDVHVYSFGPNDRSEYRQRVERDAENFHDVQHLADEPLVKLIRSHGIQILVDLMGYTGLARTSVVAARPAPIQVVWFGFPGTMGAEFIDYLIGDDVVTPRELSHGYHETIVRMPDSFMVTDHRQPIATVPFTRSDFGLPDGPVIYCAFHNSYKIDPGRFETWMTILREVPDSRLWLYGRNRTAQHNLQREAKSRGIATERLIFETQVKPKAEHLARLGLADLFLDTQFYNAHVSGCDALWAGLPVLTCPGESFASRVGASLLRAVGLPQLIAANESAYCDQAIELGRSDEKRRLLRDELNEKRLTSALFDSPRFAKNLESLYQQMWNNRK